MPKTPPRSLSAHLQTQELVVSGPLPPAIELKKYEELLPGATKTIFDLFVSETGHRQLLNKIN
jgi:uncharacterized membrane protein